MAAYLFAESRLRIADLIKVYGYIHLRNIPELPGWYR
jgi:hypothetical protein